MTRRVPSLATTIERAKYDAYRIGTAAAIKAWARAWDVPLVAPDDEELLLVSIHEARLAEPGMPAELTIASKRWLRANRERIMIERKAQSVRAQSETQEGEPDGN